uniref:Putative LOC101863888 [Aplysia californica] n=1 Tax=Lepeophtheirus salmonis TaxID=72036 RepID=A0A0K2TCJ6_LEPSM
MVRDEDSFKMDNEDIWYLDIDLLNHDDFEKRIQGLDNCIVEKVLVGISLDDMDSKLLRPVLNCVLDTSKKSFKMIEDMVAKSETRINERMNLVTSLFSKTQCIMNFLFKEFKGSNIRYFDSLIIVFPRIFKLTIDHCQKSSEIYNSTALLNTIQDSLNKLFHGIRENLNLYSRLLETIFTFDQSTKYLTSVLDDCVEYHAQLRDLDYKTLGVTWKLYARLCKSYSTNLIENQYSFTNSLSLLCRYAYESLSSILQMSDSDNEKKVMRESQMVSFILKIIRQQCELFPDNLGSDYKDLVQLIGSILMLQFRIKTSPPTVIKDKIEHEIPSINCLIVKDLILHSNFANYIFSKNPENIQEKEEFFLIILYLSEQYHRIPEENIFIRSKWINLSSLNLLETLFVSLQSFSPVMNSKNFLYGIQFHGKPLSIVFSYEVIICRVQAFLAGVGPEDFGIVEKILFKNLFSSCFWTQTLAADSLCFIARFGTSELCYSHFMLLTKVYLMDMGKNCFVEDTLRRMFSFLSDEDIKTFSKEYPFKTNIMLWSILASTKKNFPDLTRYCESKLRDALNNVDINVNELNFCLRIISKSSAGNDDLFLMLWEKIMNKLPIDDDFQCVFSNLYNWALSKFFTVDNSNILLENMEETLRIFSSSQHSCAHFLTQISRKTKANIASIMEFFLSEVESFFVKERICQVISILANRRILSDKRFINYSFQKINNFKEYDFFTKSSNSVVRENEEEIQTKKRKRDPSPRNRKEIFSKVVKILDSAADSIANELEKSDCNDVKEHLQQVIVSISGISSKLT